MAKKNAISVTRCEDFTKWYQEVIKEADFAEHSPVRGCMVIKPQGYAVWEKIQHFLDIEIKRTGHDNAYFPLFIPISFFQKEADHVEGFAKECAVVTHHKLEKNEKGELKPSGELEEPLIVRPTSEMIIGDAFSRWISSYRDLPLKLNQWCNVVRWEMRTRLFLRSTEFLWQEGHTAHETSEEALLHAKKMLGVYTTFIKDVLALPAIEGWKSEGEKFPGADKTFCFEMIMQDNKALQGGTSHYLGQNFAKASNILFQTRDGEREYVYTTSWGITTRLIGSIIMVHGDDDGLRLPPAVAKEHVVIIPFLMKDSDSAAIMKYAEEVQSAITSHKYNGDAIRVTIDAREERSGEKMWQHVKKGTPLRISIGQKEVDSQTVTIASRVKAHKDTISVSKNNAAISCEKLLADIHNTLYIEAKAKSKSQTFTIDSLQDLNVFFQDNEVKGVAVIPYCGSLKQEKEIQSEYGVTIRCLFDDSSRKEKVCLFTKQKTTQRAVLGIAY